MPYFLAISGHAAPDCILVAGQRWRRHRPGAGRAAAKATPANLERTAFFPGRCGTRFRFRRRDEHAHAVRSAAASHRRHRADAAADRAGHLWRQRHGPPAGSAARRRNAHRAQTGAGDPLRVLPKPSLRGCATRRRRGRPSWDHRCTRSRPTTISNAVAATAWPAQKSASMAKVMPSMCVHLF